MISLQESYKNRNNISNNKDYSNVDKYLENYFLKQFSKINYGCINITTLNNRSYSYGSKDSNLIANLSILDNNFFHRCLKFGTVGFAQAFIYNEIECDNLANVISIFIFNFQETALLDNQKFKINLINLFGSIIKLTNKLNENTLTKSIDNISFHYDLGNDFFKTFLDQTMTYSSGKFLNPKDTLYNAQLNKYQSIAQKLRLSGGLNILEIGSGWGGLSLYLAKNYDVQITTLTLSKEQYNYVNEIIKANNLNSKIKVLLQDYRIHSGLYDRVVSVEMIEAVGDKYFETYFSQINKFLTKDGLAVMQMILSPDSRYELIKNNIDFIQKYIFPGSIIPSHARLLKAINKVSNLNLYELEDLGCDYVKTLKMWLENFILSKEKIINLGFDEIFYRKWLYYFNYCIAAFATKNITCVQATYARPNNINLSYYNSY